MTSKGIPFLHNRVVSRIILGLFFVSATLIKMSNAIARDVSFDEISPTGYWYTSAQIDYSKLDGCFLPSSLKSIHYAALFPSFESAKKEEFDKGYKGGTCKESIDFSSAKPQDWPLSPNQWVAFQKQRPDSPKPMSIHYHCILADSNQADYSINFTLQPQYQCSDGTCALYRNGCAGDVYARDLLQFPVYLLGHTGIIYTSDEVDPKRAYLVMEVLDTPPIIHTDMSLAEMNKERPIWGVRYGYGQLNDNGEMSYMDALKMLSLGYIQSQYCPQYTKQPIYKLGSYSVASITNPFNHHVKQLLTNNCAVFRCDTFVQYLYKAALDTQLPPQTIVQMPKDLFNAFPNQRGDSIPPSEAPILASELSTTPRAKNSDVSWAIFQNKQNSVFSRSASLDAIEDSKSIEFEALLQSIGTESVDELKSQLFGLLIQKAKENQMSRQNWNDIKTISINALHDSFDPRVVINALRLSDLVLTPEETLEEIRYLLARMPNQFSDNDRVMMNNAMHASLFQILINSDSINLHHEIDAVIASLNLNRVIESFSVYINDLPAEKLSGARQQMHQYLVNVSPKYFHAKDFPKSYFRATSWSKALLKTKNSHLTPEQDLYAVLKKIDDEFVLSLLIVENSQHLTSPDIKLKLQTLLNKHRRLNPKPHQPREEATIAQARLMLTHKASSG